MAYYSYLNMNNKNSFAYELGGKLVKSTPIFLCVGNSNVVADCFGPLVGEILTKKYGISGVFGNLENNITSKNINQIYQMIKLKYPNKKVVIIDAALSESNNVGLVNFLNTGCVPACFTNFKIMGDYSILGLTNVKGVNGLMFLKTVKFNMVLNMAKFVAESIFKSINLIKKVNS